MVALDECIFFRNEASERLPILLQVADGPAPMHKQLALSRLGRYFLKREKHGRNCSEGSGGGGWISPKNAKCTYEIIKL